MKFAAMVGVEDKSTVGRAMSKAQSKEGEGNAFGLSCVLDGDGTVGDEGGSANRILIPLRLLNGVYFPG